MIWPRTLILSLLLLALSLAWIASVPEVPGGAGVDHPRIPGMQVGGDAARHRDLLWPAWAFGMAGLGVCFGLMGLGLRPASRRRAAPWMLGTALLQTFVFTAVVLGYRAEIGAAEPQIVFGLPLATAWMLWALWPAPVIFVSLFVLRFDSWVLAAEDRRRFDEILARRAARRRPASEAD